MKAAKTRDKLGASYWKLWSATGISNLGDGVAAVAYPWLASSLPEFLPIALIENASS
jgi:hypothetical protein